MAGNGDDSQELNALFNKIAANIDSEQLCATITQAVADVLPAAKYVLAEIKEINNTLFATDTVNNQTFKTAMANLTTLLDDSDVKSDLKDLDLPTPECHPDLDSLYGTLPTNVVLTASGGKFYLEKTTFLNNARLAVMFAKKQDGAGYSPEENVQKRIEGLNAGSKQLFLAEMMAQVAAKVTEHNKDNIDAVTRNACLVGYLITKIARVLKLSVTMKKAVCSGEIIYDDATDCAPTSCGSQSSNDVSSLICHFTPSLSGHVIQIAESIILKAGGCKIDDFLLTVLVMFVMDNLDKSVLESMTFIRTNNDPTCRLGDSDSGDFLRSDPKQIYLYDAQISQIESFCMGETSNQYSECYHAIALNKNGSAVSERLSIWPDTRREPVFDPDTCRASHRFFVTGDFSVIAQETCGPEAPWSTDNTLLLLMKDPTDLELLLDYARSFAINKRAPRCPRDPSDVVECSNRHPPVVYPKDFANGKDIDYPICPTDVEALSPSTSCTKDSLVKKRKLYALAHLLHIRKQLGGASEREAFTNDNEKSCSSIDNTFDICDRAMGPMYCPYDSTAGAALGIGEIEIAPESGLHAFVVDKQYIKDNNGNYYKLNDALYTEFVCEDQSIWHHKYLRTEITQGFTKTKNGERIPWEYGPPSGPDTTHSFDFDKSFEAEHSFCLLGSSPLSTRRQFLVEKIPDEVAVKASSKVMPAIIKRADELAVAGQLAIAEDSAVLSNNERRLYIPLTDGAITLETIRTHLQNLLEISRQNFYFRDNYHNRIEVKSTWSIKAKAKSGSEVIDTVFGTSTVSLTKGTTKNHPKVSKAVWEGEGYNAAASVLTLLRDLNGDTRPNGIRDVKLVASVTQKVRYVYNNDIWDRESPTEFKISSRMGTDGLGAAIGQWLLDNSNSDRNTLAIDVECDIPDTKKLEVNFAGAVETPQVIKKLLANDVTFLDDAIGKMTVKDIVDHLVQVIISEFNETTDQNGVSVFNANGDKYKFTSLTDDDAAVSALLGNGYHLNRKHPIYDWFLASDIIPDAPTQVKSSVYEVGSTLVRKTLASSNIFPDGYNAVILGGTHADVGFIVARNHSVSVGVGGTPTSSDVVLADVQLFAGDTLNWTEHGTGYNYYYPAYVARDHSSTTYDSDNTSAVSDFVNNLDNWSSSQLSVVTDQISFSSPGLKYGMGSYSVASSVQDIRRTPAKDANENVILNTYGERYQKGSDTWDAAIKHLVCLPKQSIPGNADVIPDLDALCTSLGADTVRGGVRTTTLTLAALHKGNSWSKNLPLVSTNGSSADKIIHYKTTGGWTSTTMTVNDWTAKKLVKSLGLHGSAPVAVVAVVVDGASYHIDTATYKVSASSSPFQSSPFEHDEKTLSVSAKWIVSTSGTTSSSQVTDPPKVDPAHLISRSETVGQQTIGKHFLQFGTEQKIKDAFTFSNTGHKYANGQWTVQGDVIASDMGVTGVVWVKPNSGHTMASLTDACSALNTSNGTDMRTFWDTVGCTPQQGMYTTAGDGEILSVVVRGKGGTAPIDVQSGDLQAAFETADGTLTPLPPAWTPLFTPEATITYKDSTAALSIGSWAGDRSYQTFGSKSASGITQVIATVVGANDPDGAPITFQLAALPDNATNDRSSVWSSGSGPFAKNILSSGGVAKAWELFSGIHTLSLSVLGPDSVDAKIIDNVSTPPQATKPITTSFSLSRDGFADAEIAEVNTASKKGEETNSAEIQYDYVGNIKVTSNRLTKDATITGITAVDGDSSAEQSVSEFPLRLGILAQYRSRYATSTSVILDASDSSKLSNPFGTVAYFVPTISTPGHSMTVSIIEHNLYKLSDWLDTNDGVLHLGTPYHDDTGAYGFDSMVDHVSVARVVGSRLAEYVVKSGKTTGASDELGARRLFVEKESRALSNAAGVVQTYKLDVARYFMLPTVNGTSLSANDIALYPYSLVPQQLKNQLNMGSVAGIKYVLEKSNDVDSAFVQKKMRLLQSQTWKTLKSGKKETRSDLALGFQFQSTDSTQHLGTTASANTPNLVFSRLTFNGTTTTVNVDKELLRNLAEPSVRDLLQGPLVSKGGPPIAVYDGLLGKFLSSNYDAVDVWNTVRGSQTFNASLVYWEDDIDGIDTASVGTTPFTQSVTIVPTLKKSELKLAANIGTAATKAISLSGWHDSLVDGSTVTGVVSPEAIVEETINEVGTGDYDIYSGLGPIAAVYTLPKGGFLGELITQKNAHCVEHPGPDERDDAWADVLTWSNIFSNSNSSYAFTVTEPTAEGQWSAYVTATLKIELWKATNNVAVPIGKALEGTVNLGGSTTIASKWDELVRSLTVDQKKEVYKMRSTVILTDSRSRTIGGASGQRLAERALVTHFNRTEDITAYINAIEDLVPVDPADCQSVESVSDPAIVLRTLKVQKFLGFVESDDGVYQTVQQDMNKWETRTHDLYTALKVSPPESFAVRTNKAMQKETNDLPETYFLLVRVGKTRDSVTSESLLRGGLQPDSTLQDRSVINVIASDKFKFPQFEPGMGEGSLDDDLGTHDTTNAFLKEWAKKLGTGATLDIGKEFINLVDSTVPDKRWMSITVVDAHDCIPGDNDELAYMTQHQILFNAKKPACLVEPSASSVDCDVTHTDLINAYPTIDDEDGVARKFDRSAVAQYYSEDGTSFISVPINDSEGTRLRGRDRLKLSSSLAMSGDYEQDGTHLECIVQGLETYGSQEGVTDIKTIIDNFKNTYRKGWLSGALTPVSCKGDGNAVGVSPTLPNLATNLLTIDGTEHSLIVDGIIVTIAARHGASGKSFKITGGLAVNATDSSKYPEQAAEIKAGGTDEYGNLSLLYDSSDSTTNGILQSDEFEPAVVSGDILGVYVALTGRTTILKDSYRSELAMDPFAELVKLKIKVKDTLGEISMSDGAANADNITAKLDALWTNHLEPSAFVSGIRGTLANQAEIDSLKAFISDYKLYASHGAGAGVGAVVFSKFAYTTGTVVTVDIGDKTTAAVHIASVAREAHAISSESTSGVKYGEVQTASIVFKSKEAFGTTHKISVKKSSASVLSAVVEVRGTVEMNEVISGVSKDLLATDVANKHSQVAPHVFRIAYAIDPSGIVKGADAPLSFGSHVGDSNIKFLLEKIATFAQEVKKANISPASRYNNVGLKKPKWVSTNSYGDINRFDSENLYIAVQGRNPPIAVHVVDEGTNHITDTRWPSGEKDFDKYVAVLEISKAGVKADLADAVFAHIRNGVPVDQLTDRSGATFNTNNRQKITNFLTKLREVLGGETGQGHKNTTLSSDYFTILALESAGSELTTTTLAELAARARELARQAIEEAAAAKVEAAAAKVEALNDRTSLARIIFKDSDTVSEKYTILEIQLAADIVNVGNAKKDLQNRFLHAAQRLDEMSFGTTDSVWAQPQWINNFAGGSEEVRLAAKEVGRALGNVKSVGQFKHIRAKLRLKAAYDPTAAPEARAASLLILDMLDTEPTSSDLATKIETLQTTVSQLAKEATLNQFITSSSAAVETLALTTFGGLLKPLADPKGTGRSSQYNNDSVKEFMEAFGEVISASVSTNVNIKDEIEDTINKIVGLADKFNTIEATLETAIATGSKSLDGIAKDIGTIKGDIRGAGGTIATISSSLDSVNTKLIAALGDKMDGHLYKAIAKINSGGSVPTDAFKQLVGPLANTYEPFLDFSHSKDPKWSVKSGEDLFDDLGIQVKTTLKRTDDRNLVEAQTNKAKLEGGYWWVKVTSKYGPTVDPRRYVKMTPDGTVILDNDSKYTLDAFAVLLNTMSGTNPAIPDEYSPAETALLTAMHEELLRRFNSNS